MLKAHKITFWVPSYRINYEGACTPCHQESLPGAFLMDEISYQIRARVTHDFFTPNLL